jgi:glycosyltransferase involved in cell wall biosynthesis
VLGALARRGDVDLAVLVPAGSRPTVLDLLGSTPAQVIVPPRAEQISLALWDRYRSGHAFEVAGSEVIIGTKHLVPRTRRPTLLVVHDVMTLTRANENALSKRILLPAQYRRSLTDASALVAVSVATRDRLAAINPAWSLKCEVIPNGMSEHLVAAEPALPRAIGDRPFALVVGDLSPRKNLLLLTRLWQSDRPEGLTLVVVGPDSGTDAPVREELFALERSGRVVWIRDATDGVLRWCYEHAQVVLFPSFEEGFGLPLLEAMTFHAPVVASSEAALHEVGAGSPGVTHVDPRDVAGWREAIHATVTVGTRVEAPPAIPGGAVTWAEHTERLVTRARTLARGVPSPQFTEGT